VVAKESGSPQPQNPLPNALPTEPRASELAVAQDTEVGGGLPEVNPGNETVAVPPSRAVNPGTGVVVAMDVDTDPDEGDELNALTLAPLQPMPGAPRVWYM